MDRHRCPKCGAPVRAELDPALRPFAELVESRRRRDASALRRILAALRREGWLVAAIAPKPPKRDGGRR